MTTTPQRDRAVLPAEYTYWEERPIPFDVELMTGGIKRLFRPKRREVDLRLVINRDNRALIFPVHSSWERLTNAERNEAFQIEYDCGCETLKARSWLHYWIDGIRFYKPWSNIDGYARRIETYKRKIKEAWLKR